MSLVDLKVITVGSSIKIRRGGESGNEGLMAHQIRYRKGRVWWPGEFLAYGTLQGGERGVGLRLYPNCRVTIDNHHR